MAVSHDLATESHTGTTASQGEASFSWSHGGAGSGVKGVLVFTFNNTSSSTDALAGVSGVTYGGSALTAVTGGSAVDTAGEQGRCTAWFLGTSVPQGTQTVVVTRVNNAAVIYAVAVTVLASGDTETNGVVLLQENQAIAEQNVTDGSPGTNSLRYAGTFSGLPTPPAAGANSTALQSIDLGAVGDAVVRETTAGQGSRPVGFADVTDDVAAVHLAIREVSSGTTGTIAVTETDDTSAISGVVANPVTGTIGATEGNDTSAISGVETQSGVIAATEGDDTSNFAGTVANPIIGTIAVTEEDDTAAFSGTSTSPAITGTIGVTEGDDTSNFAGTVVPPAVTGTITATEGDDTANFAGASTTPGTMNVTEEDDVGLFTGTVANPNTGTITGNEGDDTGAFTGLVSNPGNITATEGDDTANFVGIVANSITGTISAVEQNDTAMFVGSTTGGVVVALVASSVVSSWPVSSTVRGWLVESEVQ